MDKLIEVIFLNNSIWGKKDEQKFVKHNFGLFLLDRGIVSLVTQEKLVELANKKKERERLAQQKEEFAQKLFHELNAFSLFFQLKKNEKGEPFNSIRQAEITQELKKHNFLIDKGQLVNFKPIKKTGESFVEIHLGNGIIARIKLVIS